MSHAMSGSWRFFFHKDMFTKFFIHFLYFNETICFQVTFLPYCRKLRRPIATPFLFYNCTCVKQKLNAKWCRAVGLLPNLLISWSPLSVHSVIKGYYINMVLLLSPGERFCLGLVNKIFMCKISLLLLRLNWK